MLTSTKWSPYPNENNPTLMRGSLQLRVRLVVMYRLRLMSSTLLVVGRTELSFHHTRTTSSTLMTLRCYPLEPTNT